MNEIMDKVKETDDLLLLIEQHKKEIWEWKQKESKWLEDRVLLDGTKKLVNKLSEELARMKKRAQEAEGETTIVKGIGMNSPEMRAAQARIKELESSRSLDTMDEVAYRDLESREKQLESTLSSAQDINDNHQRYNGKLQTKLTEVEEDNKKLSLQINDYIKKYQDAIRKSGL